MPQDQIFQFPQATIQKTINQAVKTIYNVEQEQIHVVRQHRALRVGSLQFIDYAVPCFELAKLVDLDAATVAHTIVEKLKNQIGTEEDPDYTYEAVSGYINIQLSHAYLRQVMETAMNWLQEPKLTDQQKSMKDTFLIFGPDRNELSEYALNRVAYRYIQEIYQLIHKDHALVEIINDFSESMLDQLSQLPKQTDDQPQDIRQQITLHRHAQTFLTRPLDYSQKDPLTQQFIALQTSLISARKGDLNSREAHPYQLVTESSIAEAAQKYIDGLETTTGVQIIKDTTSQAVYCTHDDIVYMLRSANGMLYSIGYLLYVIEGQLAQLREASKQVLVIIAPHKLHALVTSYCKTVIASYALDTQIVCFDPRVSQADILELQQSINSVAEHFVAIRHILNSQKDELLENIKTRQSLLGLADLPETLTQIINNAQLPALFDGISESVEMLANFTG